MTPTWDTRPNLTPLEAFGRAIELIDDYLAAGDETMNPVRAGYRTLKAANRWAAFTNDELEVFTHWIAFFDTAASELPPHIRDTDRALIAEIPAECARRKATP